MKMKHVTLTIMALALVVAMAPSAMAICSPPKTFGSWDTNTGTYTYVTGWNQDNGLTTGSFWQTGARADHNEGTHTDDEWLRYYPGYGTYISGNLGNGGVVGCPSGNMILVMTQDNGDGSASFAASRESEGTGFFAFQQPDMTFTEIPRPRAINSSRGTGTVILDLELDDPAGGFASFTAQANPITAINLYTFHGAGDPGRDIGAWTLHSSLPYAGGPTSATAVSFDCPDDGGDTFVAAGIEFNGELVSLQVSASTALECDPTLADPGDKFDIIREKGQGQKKGKPFQRR